MPRVALPVRMFNGVMAAVILMGISPSSAHAQDQAPPCAEYVIEGSLEPSSPTNSGDENDVSGSRTASVYVHTTGDAVANVQVIATFADGSGTSIGEPSILVTDAGGRAHVEVPATAESVDFVAESPNGPGCPDANGSDPRVLLEIVPVGAAPKTDPKDELAKTGPVSDVIVVASLLLLAFGAAVGTGWGRRRALTGPTRGVKRGFSR